MKNPEVSVVIPVYNTGIILQETINSVLNQTFTDFELIIVDDGSTDPVTLDILKKQRDGRIRIIHQTNGGVAAARNRGIAGARGKYTAFLDHDDLFLPEKLKMSKEFMEKHPGCISVYSRIIPRGEDNGSFLELPVMERINFPELLNRNLIYSMSCVMVRMALIKKYRITFDPECVPCDDWDFHLQCALHGEICSLAHPVTEYRFYEGNQSKDQEKMYLAGIRTIHKYRKNLKYFSRISNVPMRILRSAVRFALSEHHYGIAFQYFCRKNYRNALIHVAKACFYRPFSPKLFNFIRKKIRV